MPESETSSDRARLIRLIDGGAEVLKEAEEERKRMAGAVQPEAPVPSAPAALPAATKKNRDAGPWIKWAVLVVLVLLGIRLVTVIWYAFEKPTTTAPTLVSPPKTDLAAVSARAEGSELGVRLVGVDWSEPPVALIEDLTTGKTYFAKQNDKVKGARIQQIFKNYVVISHHGQTEELR